MVCFVYKSLKKSDTYLFLKNKDDFANVPNALQDMLGKLEFVMEVDLAEREKLARVDSEQLGLHLEQQGFYLQLPPSTVFHSV
ncbi:YcgL domain-containing protein [Kaarinaea lacus]